MAIIARKCPIFVAGDALKGGFTCFFSCPQHSSEDISKQIRDASSSYVESGEFWRQHVDLVSSVPSSGGARYI